MKTTKIKTFYEVDKEEIKMSIATMKMKIQGN